MNCKNCGNPITNEDQFCKICGAQKIEPIAQNTLTNQNINYETSQNNNTSSTPNTIVNPIMPEQPRPMQPNANLMASPSQQINPQQVSSGYNNQNTHVQYPQKNNNAIKYVLIGLLAVAIVVGIVLIFVLNNKKTEPNNNPSESGTPVASESTYIVNYEGYEFKIPTSLVCEEENEMLMIANQEDTWVVSIGTTVYSYDFIKEQKSKISKNIQNSGYILNNDFSEKIIRNSKYFLIETNRSGFNTIIGYTPSPTNYTFCIGAININNEFDYSLLNIVEPIITSSKYVGESNGIKANPILDNAASFIK